ncbi:MAG: 6-carboxytetrahydropterin synthase QueD [Waddliaceae bacterium]
MGLSSGEDQTIVFRLTKEITFCYGHRLLNYEGKCRYLHGHNGRVEITVEGKELDDRGMLIDFGDIKHAMKRWIDNHLDHRMLLHREDPMIPFLQEQGEPLFIMSVNPTAEAIARIIFEAAIHFGFPVVKVTLWETLTSNAVYCPRGQNNPGSEE